MTNKNYTFVIDDEQIVKLNSWADKQNAKAIAAQKKNPPDVPKDLLESCWDLGYPYGGAVGGSLTYSFTPASIGVVVKVTNNHTNESIDLSEYGDW